MPTFDPSDMDGLVAFLRANWFFIVFWGIVLVVGYRLARPLVHRATVRVMRTTTKHMDDELAELSAAEAEKRAATIEDLVSKLLRGSIVALGFLIVLALFDLFPVIAGLGIVLAAITLAGQAIVLDYLMGILILVEGQYFIGDWISVGGVEGSVEEITLRRTVIRDATGTVHSVSNGTIRTSSNLTRLYAGLAVDVVVPYDTDIDRASAVVARVGREMFDDPRMVGPAARHAEAHPRRPAGRPRGDAEGRRTGARGRSLGGARRVPPAPAGGLQRGGHRDRAARGDRRREGGRRRDGDRSIRARRAAAGDAARGVPRRGALTSAPPLSRAAPRHRSPSFAPRRRGRLGRPHAARVAAATRPARGGRPVSLDESIPARPEIEGLLLESRTFPPDPAFAAQANATADLYAAAERDPEAFWAARAHELLSWFTPFGTVIDWDPPFAKWFVGGELNVAYNCVDRHVERGLGEKVAYHWIGEPGDTRTITYADLQREVDRAANALLELGVRKGDRVAIYLPMIPELPVSMLACAKIGAAHTVVFGGFSAEALADRINDAEAKVLITADGGWRRGRKVGLKHHADEALASTPSILHTIVVDRLGDGCHMVEGRDHWWADIVGRQSDVCDPVPVESEQLLYLLYTSGTTAKPKGIVHTSAGYLLGASWTHRMVFDVKPDDVYWCAADIGWVTGHSYIVYGPLANATTGVIYEGAPDTPDWDRWWEIVERYRVSILYTAPTAIRAFMKQGPAYPAKHDLSSIRLLGSVGEPINPEAWLWYHEHVGGSKAPIVDTWWQTETGSILISPLPGVTTTKPGSAPPSRCRGSRPTWWTRRDGRCRTARVAIWCSRAPGRRCFAGSTATPTGTGRRTGAGSRGCTSLATAPSATRTGTSGSSAAWTT